MIWGNAGVMTNPPTRLETRLKYRAHEKYLIDTILPNGAFHIVTGPSGIGKTTWFFQNWFDWEQGKSVLGYASHPVKWAYISLDRGLLETDRTLRRLGLQDWDLPCYSMTELIPRNGYGKIEMEPQLEMIADSPLFKDVELFVIEGLQGLTPNSARGQSQNKAEMLFAMRLQDQILNKGKTVLAFTHTPKSSDYQHDRENMLGSQALIGAASTIIRFDVRPDGTGKQTGMKGAGQVNERLVTVMGRDFPNIYLNYDREPNGGFELSSKTSAPQFTGAAPEQEVYETHTDKMLLLDMRLGSIPTQMELSLRELRQWGSDIGLGPNSVQQWIEISWNAGKLLKEGPGRYRRSQTQ